MRIQWYVFPANGADFTKHVVNLDNDHLFFELELRLRYVAREFVFIMIVTTRMCKKVVLS